MRFFAHDGKATHGPATADELLKLAAFDGDTLVCPVGSADSGDWKPALAYPVFKQMLLAPPPASAPAPAAAIAYPSVLPPPPPAPMSAPAPAAALPAPAPAPKLSPCPRCAKGNPDDSRYCGSCGARMDAGLEEPVLPPPTTLEPLVPLMPSIDPLAGFGSLPSGPSPETAAPVLPDLPRETARPVPPAPKPRAGGMGRLAEFEEPVSLPAPVSLPEPIAPDALPSSASDVPLAPMPVEAAPVPLVKRPALVGLLTGFAVFALGGLFLYNQRAPEPAHEPVATYAPMPADESPAVPAPVVEDPAPALTPVASPAPIAPPRPAPPAPPRRSPSPVKNRPVVEAPKAAAPERPRRRRRRRAPKALPPSAVVDPLSAASGEEALVESRAPDASGAPKPKQRPARSAKAAAPQVGPDGRDPLLESLLDGASGEDAGAAAEPNDAAAGGSEPMIGQRPSAAVEPPAGDAPAFALPGLGPRVSASSRGTRPQPPAEPMIGAAREPIADADPAADPAVADMPLSTGAGPGEPTTADAAPAEDPQPGDDSSLTQAREQFDFCSQLLAQAAYGDHYDTCLCKDAREAAPYRGRRGFYMSSLKKLAADGRLETGGKIASAKIQNGAAMIRARWKAGAGDRGRESVETWRLEDGLWCRAK